MYFLRKTRSQLATIGGSAVVLSAMLLAAGPAPAQQPGSSKMWPWNIQGTGEVYPLPPRPQPKVAAVAPRPPADFSALKVVVAIPASRSSFENVTLRGPDGQIRTVPLEGGRAAIVVREVTVHSGEHLTLNLMPFSQPATSGARQ